MDDSGARHLDYVPKPAGDIDWFALGGILIKEEDEAAFRLTHADFCKRWGIDYPLHSVKIRGRSREFAWLEQLDEPRRNRFFKDLESLILGAPVIGTACVIDRPGYDARYRERYGKRRWALCKTAFTIATERAAKFAHSNRRRLKVFVEESDRKSDNKIKEHYRAMREVGMPFDVNSSAKYGPLSPDQIRYTLFELRFKRKSSPLMQLADLYLYPFCRAGYQDDYRPILQIERHGRSINTVLPSEAVPTMGVKYSCFDWRKTKGEV
jgi:hypothetical protein